MGFDIRRRYRLKWSGTEYDGMEVVMSACSLGELFELDRITQGFHDNNGGNDELTYRLWADRFAIMVKYTHEWNLEDDGEPLPISVDSYHKLSTGILNSIMQAWLQATTKVAGPLPERSPDGERFPEESIPMDSP